MADGNEDGNVDIYAAAMMMMIVVTAFHSCMLH